MKVPALADTKKPAAKARRFFCIQKAIGCSSQPAAGLS